MEINSVDTLLKWLEVAPRTLGWGAVLAYGRRETNKVLLQEYITRFSTEHYLKPITEEIWEDTSPTQRNYLHAYQMDKPRLSFAASNLQESLAKLTMREVGGTHLSFTKPAGRQQWSLSRVSQKGVLDGPGLTFDINLMSSTGSVNSAGRVELDISEGADYRLLDMPSEHLQKVAGRRFQAHFKQLPKEQRIFVLNDLKFESDQFLKPSRFVIRTHNKQGSGARLSANEDESEGAVLLFVAMEGEANGQLPVDNADLKYLLPEGSSATVLLGNDMLVRQIFAEGVKRTNTEKDPFRAEFEIVNGFTEMSGYGGRGAYDKILYSDPANEGNNLFAVVVRSLITNFSDSGEGPQPGAATLRVRRMPGEVVLEWRGNKQQFSYVSYRVNEFPVERNLGSEWECVWRFRFKLEPVSGVVVLEVIEESGQVEVQGGIGTFQDQPRVVQAFPLIKVKLEEQLENLLLSSIETFVSSTPEINVFVLNSLLFRGNDSVKLDSVHFPGDLALFGQVGPTLTAFSITDLEPIMGHSETLQFATEPPQTGLTWEVRNILGQDVPKGTITPSGLYTAPTAAEIQGSSVRVVVTATDGTHTSSTLVGITSRSMSVNPMIMIATAGDPLAHDFSAGAVDGGPLDWSMEDPNSDAVVKPNPGVDRDHSYVPGQPKEKSPPTIDTIVVHNPRTKQSETARVLVLHRAADMQVVINDKAGLPDNQIQLSIMGEEGPINPGDWGETWKLELGGGSAQIDAETGLLTLNPAGSDKFLVITVLVPPARPGGAWDDGYILLPLPLFSVPDTIRMLCADSQE